VHENDVWLYVLEGEMYARVGDEVVKATPGCWVLKLSLRGERAGVRRAKFHPLGELAVAAKVFRVDS
jgi:uncharacterized cupin superfamily protein